MKYAPIMLLMLVSAASARELTLEQALRLAEQHSHALKEAELNRLSAEKAVSAAQAERFPTLSLDATAKYVDEVPSLNINIPGMFQLSRDLGSNETYQTDLRMTIPIYTGGRISSAIAVARSGRDYRIAMNDLERDRTFLQARLDYFGYIKALALGRAAEASLKRTTILRDDVRSLYNAGAADSVDLLETHLAYTKADFQVRQAEISTESQRINLVSRLGLAAREQIESSDTIPDPPQSLSGSGTTGQRPELQVASAGVGMTEGRVRSEQAGYLPTLAVFGGYSYGKPNIDPFSDKWNDNFTVGAKLQWSLNLGGSTTAKKSAAIYDRDAAQRRYDNVAETIARNTDLAYEQLKLAHQRYQSTANEWQLAGANYELAREQHRNGALTSNRLLDIEAALTQAEASLAACKVDFYIAQSAYYYALADERLGKGL
jgi:outer membrane protein TolC